MVRFKEQTYVKVWANNPRMKIAAVILAVALPHAALAAGGPDPCGPAPDGAPGQAARVQAEIQDLADLAHVHDALLKVIIETALLDAAEIEQACGLCAAAGADYVKTSTGFASRGASVADVELMRRSLPENVRIKAAGGIRTRAAALALIAAGADRIGSSNSVALIAETDETLAA